MLKKLKYTCPDCKRLIPSDLHGCFHMHYNKIGKKCIGSGAPIHPRQTQRMQQIVISDDSDFTFSYEFHMALAKRKGYKLYASIAKKDAIGLTIRPYVFEPYTGGPKQYGEHISYHIRPLHKTGQPPALKYRWPECMGGFTRDDPDVVALVKQLGNKAANSNLRVVEIPDGVEWYIDSDNEGGPEVVAEQHRVWS